MCERAWLLFITFCQICAVLICKNTSIFDITGIFFSVSVPGYFFFFNTASAYELPHQSPGTCHTNWSVEDRGQNFNWTNDITCLRGAGGKNTNQHTFCTSMTPLHHASMSNTCHATTSSRWKTTTLSISRTKLQYNPNTSTTRTPVQLQTLRKTVLSEGKIEEHKEHSMTTLFYKQCNCMSFKSIVFC